MIDLSGFRPGLSRRHRRHSFGARRETTLGNLDDELVEEITDTAAIERLDLQYDDRYALSDVTVRHADATSVPEPVRALVSERFPGGRLVRYGTSTETGATVLYHAYIQAGDGRACDLATEGGGEVVYTECSLPTGELPQPVVDRLNSLDAIEIVRLTRREGAVTSFYVIELRQGGRAQILEITDDGEILQRDAIFQATIRVPYLGQPSNAGSAEPPLAQPVDPEQPVGPDEADVPETAPDFETPFEE